MTADNNKFSGLRASRTELLKQKLTLILRMRDLTASIDITNSHAEEQYITLMTRREAIMAQLRDLDLRLEDSAPEEGADIILGQIREASEQILEMDNELSLRIPDLMKGLKNHLKQLKDGRNINRAYHNDVFGIIGEGSYSRKK